MCVCESIDRSKNDLNHMERTFFFLKFPFGTNISAHHHLTPRFECNGQNKIKQNTKNISLLSKDDEEQQRRRRRRKVRKITTTKKKNLLTKTTTIKKVDSFFLCYPPLGEKSGNNHSAFPQILAP